GTTGNVHLAPGRDDVGGFGVTVRASNGPLTNDKFFMITVGPGLNRCPSASPGGPYSGLAGAPVNFDGSNSSDPDGDPLTYAWDFDATDGIGVDAVGPTPSHVFPSARTYTVT